MKDKKRTVGNVEQGWAEYSRTQESEKDGSGYEVIGHVLSSHVGESLSKYAEALPQFGWEVRVAREDSRPGKLYGRAQILLLLVQSSHGWNFEWVDLAVTALHGSSDHGTKRLLEVAVTGQL